MSKTATLLVLAVVACSGGSGDDDPTPDAPVGCDPSVVLPSNYRPIPMVSGGAVTVTTTSGVTSGTVDATAGGLSGAADNPYVYVDLAGAAKVAVDDVAARASMDWDVALKRSSLRINGGDSGRGGRKLAVVQAADLASVTAPSAGYSEDNFADEGCANLESLPGGEPASAFGEWYDYDPVMHTVTPKAEAYVIERPDGTRTALRVETYYGDAANPMRGAFYRLEWKQLAP